MEKSIFKLAGEYNFEAVKAYYDRGHSINICDDSGDSLFAKFLDGYGYYGDNDGEDEIYEAHEEWDYEFWDGYLSEKQKTPLKERNGGRIVEQMDWFLANGADINLCDLSKTGSVETPLFMAVFYEDFYLTEYLLEHGADPKIWLSDDEYSRSRSDYEIWLIEHMDVKMMESQGERFDNELRIAAILAKYGLVDFGGYCISIDEGTRTIEGHSPQWKF